MEIRVKKKNHLKPSTNQLSMGFKTDKMKHKLKNKIK